MTDHRTDPAPFRLFGSSVLFVLFLQFVVVPAAMAAAADADGETTEPIATAVASFEAGELDAARRQFEAIGKAQPDNAVVLYYLGRLALEAENQPAAEALLKRAVALDGSSDQHLWYGRALLEKLQKANMFAKATLAPKVRGVFEAAVRLDPASLEARSSLGSYYLSAPAIVGGSRVKAREQAEAMVEIDRAVGLIFLARVLVEDGDADGAIKVYLDAIEADPDNGQLRYRLGMIYQSAERWDQAIAMFEKAEPSMEEPLHAIYQVGRTGALSACHLETAAAALERVIRDFAQPGSSYYASVHWRLAMVREHQERTSEAIAAYRKALELDPDRSEARQALKRLSAGR